MGGRGVFELGFARHLDVSRFGSAGVVTGLELRGPVNPAQVVWVVKSYPHRLWTPACTLLPSGPISDFDPRVDTV